MSLLASLVQDPEKLKFEERLKATNQGQMQYDQNMFAQMKRLPNLLDRRGKISQDALGNVSVPMPDDQYLRQAQSYMPSDVPIDAQKVLADKQMINQTFDMQAGQQLANLRQTNTERSIIKTLQKSNPALLDYYVSNNLIAPMADTRPPGFKALGSLATSAGIYGGSRGLQEGATVPQHTKEQLQGLASKGFKFEDGKIKKLKPKDLIAMQDPKGSPIKSPQNKKIAERIAKDVLKDTKVSDLGKLGKTALQKGTGTFAGNIATNRALQAAVGGGSLLTRMFAGGRAGALLGGPYGAIAGSILLPMAAEFAVDAFKD